MIPKKIEEQTAMRFLKDTLVAKVMLPTRNAVPRPLSRIAITMISTMTLLKEYSAYSLRLTDISPATRNKRTKLNWAANCVLCLIIRPMKAHAPAQAKAVNKNPKDPEASFRIETSSRLVMYTWAVKIIAHTRRIDQAFTGFSMRWKNGWVWISNFVAATGCPGLKKRSRVRPMIISSPESRRACSMTSENLRTYIPFSRLTSSTSQPPDSC